MLGHHIFETASAMIVATDMNIELATTCIPLCFKMCLGTQTTFLSLATMVATAGISVPSGGLPTIAVVLCEVHLCTARNSCTATRVAIAADTTIRTTRVGQIEVVIHIPVCSRQIHIPFNVAAACHVE